MMVVYGTRRKVKFVRKLGRMTCTNCGHDVEAAVAKEGGYFHIYYIPMFPAVGGLKFIACPNCGVMRTLNKQEFKSLKKGEQ